MRPGSRLAQDAVAVHGRQVLKIPPSSASSAPSARGRGWRQLRIAPPWIQKEDAERRGLRMFKGDSRDFGESFGEKEG